MYLRILLFQRDRFMKLFWLEDQLESLKFNKCFQISLMERHLTDQSIQMKQLPMEQLYKQLSYQEKEVKMFKISYFLM